MLLSKLSLALSALVVLFVAGTALAHGHQGKPGKPAKPTVECKLVTTEAPAGGRLEVSGKNFGKSPLVKIAGKVAKLIERYEDTIAVQIAKKSPGGAVTVHADGQKAECGELRIIGKN